MQYGHLALTQLMHEHKRAVDEVAEYINQLAVVGILETLLVRR